MPTLAEICSASMSATPESGHRSARRLCPPCAINDQSGAQQLGPAFALPRAGFDRISVPSIAARPRPPERAIG
jgi:hypothetical protein